MRKDLNVRANIALGVIFAFLLNAVGTLPSAQAQLVPKIGGDFRLPAPGAMVHLSSPFDPPVLKGIKVHPDNPFRFNFILDPGDEGPSPRGGDTQVKQEATRLIKYFLTSLTIPENDLWVNLSPYEKDRIIPHNFGLTEMGRDLLAEDYMLKQITASLIYPEGEIGKRFWKRIYQEAAKRYGTTNIFVNTFNKVWIVPGKAVVYENSKSATAYVVDSKLKVMLEEDYLSFEKHEGIQSKMAQSKGINQLGSQIVREIVIPELTQEVNKDKNFSHLRQVYNSLILAYWYKNKIKDSILAQVYEAKNKVAGISIRDPQEKERIYQRYLQAFKKGVYNYIKEEQDPMTQEVIPRKYFSGGTTLSDNALVSVTTFIKDLLPRQRMHPLVQVNIDLAMPAKIKNDILVVEGQIGNTVRPFDIIDPQFTIWNMELQKSLSERQDLTSLQDSSKKYERIFNDVRNAHSQINAVSISRMYDNLRQYPERILNGRVIKMNDYWPVTAQHVLLALAFYILQRPNPLTQRELADLNGLIQQYNEHPDADAQLKTFTLFALTLSTYFESQAGFRMISKRLIEVFKDFPDNSELKVGVIATCLFLNAIHHTAISYDADDDILNDLENIKFLRNLILKYPTGSGKLGPEFEEIIEMARIAVTRTLIFLVPLAAGKLTPEESVQHLTQEGMETLRKFIYDNMEWIPSLIESYYPDRNGKITQDIGSAGFSAELYYGNRHSRMLKPQLDEAYAYFGIREPVPSLDDLFLRPKGPHFIVHDTRLIKWLSQVKVSQVEDNYMYNGQKAKRLVKSTWEGLAEVDKTWDKSRAMLANGGIDLTRSHMNIQTKVDSPFRGNDKGIHYHIDPAMLQQLQDAPGFTIGSITIKPLKSLPEFFGIDSTDEQGSY